MDNFIRLEGLEGEYLLINVSQISTIDTGKDAETSTLIMNNGTEFELKGTVSDITPVIAKSSTVSSIVNYY